MNRRFNWEKLGRVFTVNAQHGWMHSHTTPIAALVMTDRIRVYFSTREKPDQNGNFVSNSSFIDVNKDNPVEILYVHDKPLFDFGRHGTFDEFGVMVTDVIQAGDLVYLYYAGWQRLGGGTAAYQVMLGLGISKDNGISFEKYSEGPIMSIDTIDPISIGNVAVLKDREVYRMFYTSLTEWFITGNKPTYEYVIRYAESEDGIVWKKTGKTVVDKRANHGVATPCVIKLADGYHMWFGYRKGYDETSNVGGYSIGYAYSYDCIDWDRKDEVSGFIGENNAWDDQMQCYPSVVEVNGNTYMFYCGNSFGLTGFGVARLKIAND